MTARATTPVALLATLALAACGGDGATGEAPPGGDAMSAESGAVAAPEESQGSADGETVLDGTVNRLNGEPQDLSAYRGKVVLVVNTASECGFSGQFEGLEELYREKRDEGFVILGFPADDVANQEPRSDEEIAQYCKANFGVTFPMFEKTNVKDDPVNPVFEKLNADLGEPTWNFNKYLLGRDGRPVEHFDVQVEPSDPALTSAIDRQLSS
jgi:glutathione peroxidase